MRIIAGTHRGTRLASLGKGDSAAHLRPTPDRVRESLFSLLTHRGVLAGARVLDLFAGTGALGLEALSRGAAHATFVDNGRRAQALIAENIAKLRVEGDTTLLRTDATRLGATTHPPFDLIFLDPPYGKGMGELALSACHAGGWCAEGCLLVWEESAPMAPPPGFVREDTRRYGDTHITLLTTEAV